MSTPDFVSELLGGILEALQPLVDAGSSIDGLTAFLADLGWSMDPAVVQVPAEIEAIVASIDDLATHAADFASSDEGAIASAVVAGLVDVQSIAHQFAALQSAATTLPAALKDSALPERVFALLVCSYLYDNHPRVFGVLRLLGVIDEIQQGQTTGEQIPATMYELQLDVLGKAVTDPSSIARDVYGWGATFDADRLMVAIERAATAFGLGVTENLSTGLALYYDASSAIDTRSLMVPLWTDVIMGGGAIASGELDLVIVPIPPAGQTSGSPEGIAFYPQLIGQAADSIVLSDDVTLTIGGKLDASGAIRAEVRPSGAKLVTPLGATASVTVRVDAKPASPYVVLGTASGSRLEIGQAHGLIAAVASPQDIALQVGVGVDQGSIVVDFGQGDGFLQTVLGGKPQRFTFAAGVTWSTTDGLQFNGSATPQFDVPVNLNVAGVLSVSAIHLGLGQTTDGKGVSVEVSASGGLSLGPLTATVQRLGVLVEFEPHAAHDGNLGDYDLAFGFKAPNGLGLALSAPGVSGVGFLSFDASAGRYMGAAAVSIGPVSISAIGVLDTRLPSGAKGYSLVVLASVVFPPVQLGFGFSLTGVGGLVGVNRTTNVPGLQALARAGGLDSLMFPMDIVHHAPQLASNLGTLFPDAEGHFIIGPAVRLIWGTSGILDIEVGVFIELSDLGGGVSLLRVALLGWVHMTLPDAKAPIADITLDILGLVDIPAKTLSIDGGLRNSKVAGFTLTGQMAVRAGWGANASFVLALGGFNPHFAAPAGFPQLNRLALSLGGNNPRLRLSAYLALTSNTLQLGAAADLYASAGPAAVAASASFDALVQFKPFGLVIDLSVSASFLLNGSPVLSLSLALHLSGPDPWHVTGKASIQVLFWSVSVPINLQIGPSPPPQPAQTVDLDANLTAALVDPHSRQTSLPTGTDVVVLTGGAAANSSALHPLGSLTVRQSAVPLETRIDRYGPDLLDTPCKYTLGTATLAGDTARSTAVTGQFAPAQFITLSDDQKLSAPSFEPLTAGATLTPAATGLPVNASNPPTVADAVSSQQWQLILFDSPDPPGPTTAPAGTTVPAATPAPTTSQLAVDDGASIDLPPALLAIQLAGAAASVNGSAGRGSARYAAPPSGIAPTDPQYLVLGLNLADPEPADTNAAALDLMASAPAGVAPSQVIQVSELPGG